MSLAPLGSAQEMSAVPARVTIPDGTPAELQLAESGVSSASRQEYIFRADPVFQAQTVFGEAYYSDSRVLFLDLQQN
jgi:hypothetical protein